MQMAIVIMMVVVLSEFLEIEAHRHGHREGYEHGEGHRHGHKGGYFHSHRYGKHNCGEQTRAYIPPCWTGHVSCPSGTLIHLKEIQCKDRCTKDKPGTCNAALQTTINTDCNGKTECTVKGVAGTTCSAHTTVVFVNWSCNTTIVTVVAAP